MATKQATSTRKIFKKGNTVTLPNSFRPSAREGVVTSDNTILFEGVEYCAVRIRQGGYRPTSADTVILLKADDLRLKVSHPSCPSCQCFVGQDLDEEEDELEEDEEAEIII